LSHVGFIGLGRLGRHLAASLQRAGFPIVVHDLDRGAGEGLGEWAESARSVGERCETVFTCLPSPAAVTAVVEELAEGLRPGSVWIDSSTNDRHEIERLAALLRERGVETLEAPLTGGVHRAATGEITVLAGGDEAVFASRRPLLEAIGGEVIHVGPLGSASAIKVITNLLALAHVVLLGEALMLARRAGIDLARAYEAIRASSGNSFVHETESPLILDGSYDVGFTMDLACKDLRLAAELGDELGVPLALGTLVRETFEQARAEYGGKAWSTMVVKLLEDALDTDLCAHGFPRRSADRPSRAGP
jgi:3-hydroxyisobutyrate dehydrogenase